MSVIVYFGVPGTGKTTLAAKIVYQNARHGVKTYSNVPITGALLVDSSDIGVVDISDGDLILDEAAIEYNNRSYKTMPKSTISWFKLHRHYGIRTIHVFSQSYEDMDITLRRLQTCLYRTSRTIVPGVFMARRIAPVISIDRDTHQIAEQYRWSGLPRFYCGYRYWPMFDSYQAPELPQNEFESVSIHQGPGLAKRIREASRRVRRDVIKAKLLRIGVALQTRLVMRRLSRLSQSTR